MIAIFDEDGGGDVDFQEFVTGLSAFSSKGNKTEKLRFAFKVYDIDRDGYISNGELFIVLKMMVGNNLKDIQLQQIVDKTIMEADKDGDGRISFEEFTGMVESTDVNLSMTLSKLRFPRSVRVVGQLGADMQRRSNIMGVISTFTASLCSSLLPICVPACFLVTFFFSFWFNLRCSALISSFAMFWRGWSMRHDMTIRPATCVYVV